MRQQDQDWPAPYCAVTFRREQGASKHRENERGDPARLSVSHECVCESNVGVTRGSAGDLNLAKPADALGLQAIRQQDQYRLAGFLLIGMQ